MTRQIVRTAALGTAVLLAGAASVAFGAEPYPNPHRIVRYLDAEADATVNGVVNNGTIYKRGKGTATLPAPALNGGGSLVVSEGGVALDLDAAPAVPTLPASLTAKIKLWLDPGVNIVVEDGLVTKWFDRRETNITDEVASYVYPYASSEFHWMASQPADDRRPSLVASGPNLNGAYLDFGAYGADNCKWLCITNTGRAYGNIYAREVFAVCARKGTLNGFTMFSSQQGANRGRPSWAFHRRPPRGLNPSAGCGIISPFYGDDKVECTLWTAKATLLQPNCNSVEELLDAQAHPERHQNLMVKVCGFSARFVSLSKRFQDEVIARHRLR